MRAGVWVRGAAAGRGRPCSRGCHGPFSPHGSVAGPGSLSSALLAACERTVTRVFAPAARDREQGRGADIHGSYPRASSHGRAGGAVCDQRGLSSVTSASLEGEYSCHPFAILRRGADRAARLDGHLLNASFCNDPKIHGKLQKADTQVPSARPPASSDGDTLFVIQHHNQ